MAIQFVNIVVLLLIADFSLYRESQALGLPLLLGKHKDFGSSWYADVGVKITCTTIAYSLSPFVSRLIGEPLLWIFIRWWDRRWSRHLRRVHNSKAGKRGCCAGYCSYCCFWLGCCPNPLKAHDKTKSKQSTTPKKARRQGRNKDG